MNRLFRGGLIFRALGIGLATRDGSEPSRLRAFGRALIAWSPLLLLVLLSGSIIEMSGGTIRVSSEMSDAARISAVALVSLFFAGVGAAVVSPARGWQDRLTGTWLVPR